MKVYFGKIDLDHPHRWVMTVELDAEIKRSMALYRNKDAARNDIKVLKQKYQLKAKLGRCNFGNAEDSAYYVYLTFKTSADETFFIVKVSDGIEI